jgi:hypothetical protein
MCMGFCMGCCSLDRSWILYIHVLRVRVPIPVLVHPVATQSTVAEVQAGSHFAAVVAVVVVADIVTAVVVVVAVVLAASIAPAVI